jgi:hypothetical protein
MLTVVGLLVYAVIQRQVRLYLRDHDRQVPGNKGPTAPPTAAVVFALFTPIIPTTLFNQKALVSAFFDARDKLGNCAIVSLTPPQEHLLW